MHTPVRWHWVIECEVIACAHAPKKVLYSGVKEKCTRAHIPSIQKKKTGAHRYEDCDFYFVLFIIFHRKFPFEMLNAMHYSVYDYRSYTIQQVPALKCMTIATSSVFFLVLVVVRRKERKKHTRRRRRRSILWSGGLVVLPSILQLFLCFVRAFIHLFSLSLQLLLTFT